MTAHARLPTTLPLGLRGRDAEPQALAVFRTRTDDGQEFRLVLVGDSRERYLLSRHFLPGVVRLERLEFLPRLRASAALRGLEELGDLVMVSLPLIDARGLSKPWSVAPRRLSLKAEVSQIIARLEASVPPFGKYARQMARAEFQTELCFGRDAWKRFYVDFYAPTQRALRGARARLRAFEEYERHTEPAEVLAITQFGQWVASAACYRDGADYVFVELGFRDGSRSIRAMGAGHALYISVFRRAQSRRLSHVELGLHPPFVLDPVMHYKRQWLARFSRSPYCDRAFGLRLGTESQRGLELLARAPLVVEAPSSDRLALWSGTQDGVARHLALADALALTPLAGKVAL